MATENKLNWKKDLDKFNLLNAKILYMIYYFFNINHFDNEQKKKLKELVILENSDIINSFKKFEKDSNLNDLEKEFQHIYNNEISVNKKTNGLKSIIHIAFESTINVEKNKQNIEVNDDDDEDDEDKNMELLNSPMGSGLMERKKKKQKKNEQKTFITNALGQMKHNNSESDDEGDY